MGPSARTAETSGVPSKNKAVVSDQSGGCHGRAFVVGGKILLYRGNAAG